MTKPSAVLVLKMAVALSVREILFLPLWWYTTGARETLGKLLGSIQGSVRYFGVDVWAKNLFVPMYGDESVTVVRSVFLSALRFCYFGRWVLFVG